MNLIYSDHISQVYIRQQKDFQSLTVGMFKVYLHMNAYMTWLKKFRQRSLLTNTIGLWHRMKF